MALTYSAPAMNTLAQAATQAADATFVGEVAIAAAVIAQAVLDDPSPPGNQAQRAALARVVLANPLGMAQQSIAYPAVAGPASELTDVGSDILILDRVAAIWDYLSSGF